MNFVSIQVDHNPHPDGLIDGADYWIVKHCITGIEHQARRTLYHGGTTWGVSGKLDESPTIGIELNQLRDGYLRSGITDDSIYRGLPKLHALSLLHAF